MKPNVSDDENLARKKKKKKKKKKNILEDQGHTHAHTHRVAGEFMATTQNLFFISSNKIKRKKERRSYKHLFNIYLSW